jgi:hypothetical protein
MVAPRRSRRTALAFAALLAGALAGSAVAQAAVAPTFSVHPAEFNPSNPATRSYFIREVRPGQSFTDGVVVRDTGSQALTLLVYAADGLTGQTTGVVYANRGPSANEGAAAWLHADVSRITLQPGQQRTVSFSVHVPVGTAPGDHLAGVAFQDAQASTSGQQFRIREVIREVVGVLIRVPGAANPELHVGPLRLEQLPGTDLGAIAIRIANSGRLYCKPLLAVSLQSGGSSERIVRPLDTVLPQTAVTYPLILTHGLAPGAYLASARLSCARSTVATTERLSLDLPLRGAHDASPATHLRSGSGIGWMVFGIAGLAALVGMALGRGWRRRSGDRAIA